MLLYVCAWACCTVAAYQVRSGYYGACYTVAGFGANRPAKHGEFSYQGYFDRGSHPTANAECDLSIIIF
jgi:hypothetical protein